MNIQIDYQPYTEQVNIVNGGIDSKLWRQFYTFLCDYLPAPIVIYSEWSISFPWRYYLSLKGYIGQFVIAHRDQIQQVMISDIAKRKTKSADDTSYSTALKLSRRSQAEIRQKLLSVGFLRDLTDNQVNNLQKISQLPGAATFSVPGAGKTTEALAFFFLNSLDSDRLLVVAPKNAFGAWDEQLLSCVPECDEYFVRLRGGENSIEELLRSKPRFMIITYDQLPRVKSLMISLLSSGNVFMFLDESHRVKGGKQVKRAETVLELAHLPKRKLIMSGTPMPQSPKDLISQFVFLYPEMKVDEASVIDDIQPIYVRTTKGQLGIPEVNHIVKMIEMPRLQREIYKSLRYETKRQMTSLGDSSKYELRRLGKCIMKVMEFVSNPALLATDMNYVFDRRVGQLLLDNDGPKIDYVCKRARQLASEGKKVIIWSCFVQNVELIAMRLSDLGAEYIHGSVDAGDENATDTREGKIKRFHDDPNCMVLVANPAACSEGISLHKVCQYAIYLDRSFNAAHYLQSEDRIHRLGLAPDSHPTVEFVECANSIDQVVRDRLERKVAVMASALNDTSLKVVANVYDEDDDDELDDISVGLNSEDAKALVDYFFSGEIDD